MDKISQAVNLMETDQTEKALQLLDEFLNTANDDEKFSIANLYLQWGLIQEASTIIMELLEKYPDEAQLKIMQAEIYTELEQDEQAIQLLDEINEDDEAYLQVLVQLADLFQSQGLYEVAEQKLLKAKQMEPNERIIDFALGELYFSIGEFRKATTYYERVNKYEQEIGTISLSERLAEAYARIGEYETALTYFEQADPDNTDLLFRYGFTAMQAKRNDIAINVLEKVIKEDIYYHSAYYHLAQAYEGEEQTQEAYEAATKGIKVDEFNKELYFYAGKLAHKLGKNEESVQYVQEAIALDQEYKEAILFLIEFFKEQEKYREIVELVSSIKETDAIDPLYDWELARAYNELEEYDYALKHYREAYNSLQHDDDFLKEFGYFLSEEGRIKEAIEVFEAYLKQQPLDDDVSEYITRLKSN
ncbi:tetratricopeptide repeat protein [Ornithinibacillus halophilus]|uniref:Tetratricopeptide repeat-containing protein n=1 Tax=Ornithinibacillus halophilus TaxID=930117 RepID=A0A1M5CPN8_9BACI|nr:tetratricopeptide repeat protein [Ornithinibacillus halophilus]SHF56663.1 Tetratricopeptide repeat-containing protein [Ornithinibacillus halophilus]